MKRPCGGIALAVFSIDHLFDVSINDDVYFDMVQVGFFFIGPLTAIIWLPGEGKEYIGLPRWIRGAVRIILIPLCIVYALILFVYIGKIALSAQWPDGWVAMPTLIFAAMGLVVYLVLREMHVLDEGGWPVWFCRLFPVVLLPLTVVLLLAMRIRVQEYGFTAWRTAGIYLGGWLFIFAVVYAARPRISEWWVGFSLALLFALAAFGPFSLNAVALRSQQARVDTILEELKVWQRSMDSEVLDVTGKQGQNLSSSLEYLMRTYGMKGLPENVAERWAAWRKQQGKPDVGDREWHYIRSNDVIESLGLRVVNSDEKRYITLYCSQEPFEISGWRYASSGGGYEQQNQRIRLENDFRILIDGNLVATQETARVVQALDVLIAQSGTDQISVAPEKMTIQFKHEGKDNLLFVTVPVTRYQEHSGTNHYQTGYARFVLFTK